MRALLFGLILGLSLPLTAQIYEPVKWAVTLNPAGDGQYTLLAKATIDNGWWVYSQYLDSEDGPIATTVNYDEGSHYKLVGKNKESDNAKKAFDKFFEMNVTKFSSYYTIEQKIKVLDPSKPITGYLNYMTCNDDRCLPPVDVEFTLYATGGSTGDAGTATPAKDGKTITPSGSKPASVVTPGEAAGAEKKKIN